MDAIELLKRDHQEVTKLFQRFSGGEGGRGRRQVVEQICNELDVHAQIEEQVFYPAVRETGDSELRRLVDESLQEHQRVKQQVSALRRMDAEAEDQVEGTVSTLEQDVEHHVAEEEGEMFPRVAEVIDDEERGELGARLASLKQELTGEARGGTRGRSRSGRQTGRAAAGRKAASGRGRSGGAGRRSSGRGGGQARGRKRASATGAKARTASARRRSRGSSTGRKQGRTGQKSNRRKTTGRKSRTGRKQVRGGRR